MDRVITYTVGLLVAAILVALIARRLRLPYTVGLVIAGVGLAATRVHFGVTLTHDLIFNVILPPLLFEAAINIHWRELQRDMLPILTLAVAGTLVSAAVVAAGLVVWLRWDVPAAMLFGALIAATDPVAVIAMFKDNAVGGRLRLLVECESLFNDGVAAVLFVLVAGAVTAGSVGTGEVARTLVTVSGGGILIGLGCAAVAIGVAGRTADHLVESLLTTVAAYGPFLLAEHFQMSGVLAAVTSGLVVGNVAILPEEEERRLRLNGREFVLGLWEFFAFVANSVVFLLLGVTVAGVPLGGFGLMNLAVVIGLVLLSRAVTVYPFCLLFAGSRWRVPMGAQHVMWWGGLRGALALALALSLPAEMAGRGEILVAAFGVVAFSVVVQGLTMPLLLKRAK